MPTVQQIADFFEERVPSSLALGFDNVGLLCGYPENEVTRVLFALDATVEVIEEAAQLGAELIVTHHPVIFTPMKQILSTDPEGDRIIRALRNRISIISLHTNLDAVDGGVNTTLAGLLGLQNLSPLEIGRMGTLPEAVNLDAFLARLQQTLAVSGMRYLDAGKPVSQVAVCGGSGGDLVAAAADAGCDTLVTGEIRHHQWLEGKALGINLIEADHYCTEVVAMPALAEMIADGFPSLHLRISSVQSQPSRGYC